MTPAALTVADVAALRKVSPATVRAWIDRGELVATVESIDPRSKRPRYRVEPEALEAFLATRRVQADARPAPKRRRASGVTPYF